MNRPLVLCVSLALLAAVPAAAEEGQHGLGDHDRHAALGGGALDRGIPDPERHLARLQRVLDLTELQRQAIENALLAAQPQIDALREESRANRQAMAQLDSSESDYAEQLAALADERGRLTSRKTVLHGQLRADISAQLTAEQRLQLQNAQERRKSRRSERRRQRHERRTETQ